MTAETEAIVKRVVLEYAQNIPAELHTRMSLQRDLAIESLALVALTLRLGDEFEVDVVEAGLDLGSLKTVGDLFGLARQLSLTKKL
jgi:acyl carrier protein